MLYRWFHMGHPVRVAAENSLQCLLTSPKQRQKLEQPGLSLMSTGQRQRCLQMRCLL
ncbi:hypothetical protein ALP86_102070 [Pseudomonas amygdali pv. mori]|uniref:Uncharacterized protein n=2 Tax=Pseudomonas syringae group genomosp. 2 TaxID=251698 RepID=A0A0P9UWA5_PSEA0|nr:hypothetical protein ALO82_102002 [Pseudomonas syringae pv. broussonetiae]KPX30897.1 hypothetical protein ALO69_102232 [Pseudomonas ficuserectae]KPX94317.1 hypothetical protein ALO63_102130 [Pseudomonas amygdali pv. mori]RMR42573.1 hypothetical protein ALP86_102070 [Pseudomonas amygdali pv. mori]RMT24155.1 hypothetical protein ALP51_102110 [Pseudomonas savastanoi]